MDKLFQKIYFHIFPMRVTLYYKSGNRIRVRVVSLEWKTKDYILQKVDMVYHPLSSVRLINFNLDTIETITVG